MILRIALLWPLLLSFATLARTPWTASHLQGSPEPPKAYIGQRIYEQKSFKELLEFATAKGSGRLFAVERAGKIWSFEAKQTAGPDKDLLIDLKAAHPDLDYAYGLAFHPNWRENREVYICYALGQGVPDGTRLCRFHLDAINPPRLDPKSEEVMMTWVSGGHNGANLQFGPDGFLYISTGDAESPAPPDARNTGQDISDLLSSILRIDVDHRDSALAYAVPKDNPFYAKKNVRPEVWAFGLRNPWKMSFDEQGRLWCGDVGWELWEMIHLIERGGNYGWSAMEATQPVKPDSASKLVPITPPIVAHPHTEAASITGGYVYRGKELPELRGAYIYGDYETGKIWALWHDGKKIIRHEEIADTSEKIVTFGLTEDGELVYAHWGSPWSIHRLVRNPATARPSSFPRLLSQTGLYADTPKQTPQEGVFEYDVAESLWEKGMWKKRLIAIPGTATAKTEIQRDKNGVITNTKITWPKDSVLARTVSVAGTPPKPVETQVLHYDGETWNGYSYRWNTEGTDAQLVGPNGEDSATAHGPYRFHSRAECMRCHTPWAGFAIGFQAQQLRTIGKDVAAAAGVALGLVDAAFFEGSSARLVGSQDHKANLEDRARSWLHGNCAHCHRDNGGGSVAIKLNIEKKLDEMKLVGEKPLRGEFGLTDARIIAPGEPSHSVLIARTGTVGSGHMPLLGCQEPDLEFGLPVLWKWIEEMGGRAPRPQGPHPATVNGLSFDPSVSDLLDRMGLQRSQGSGMGLHPDTTALLARKGDLTKGRELLSPTGKLAACFGCHFIQGTGREFGPDLSTVGARLSPEQLLESLLQPSKVIAPGFTPYFVETQTGGAQTGFMVKQDAGQVVLKLATGQSLSVPRSELKSLKPLPVSLMPEGLIQSLTLQEAADLLAYLASLR